jgi:hypothetical protein
LVAGLRGFCAGVVNADEERSCSIAIGAGADPLAWAAVVAVAADSSAGESGAGTIPAPLAWSSARDNGTGASADATLSDAPRDLTAPSDPTEI